MLVINILSCHFIDIVDVCCSNILVCLNLQEIQVYGPIVYELYAEMELSHTSNSSGREYIHQKVLHILSCLGSGIPYTVFKGDNLAKATDILKAKHGFKEQIQIARKRRNQAYLSDQFRSFVACAAMFELLADGLGGAVSVFEESFAMSLPGLLPLPVSTFERNFYKCFKKTARIYMHVVVSV